MCTKVLSLISENERSLISCPKISEGDERIQQWRNNLRPVLKVQLDTLTSFLKERNMLKQDQKLTQSVMKDKNVDITKAMNEKFGE